MFKKILIANRGEVALRIIRACQDLGIKTVAIHSTIDENSLHVKMADEAVCIGGNTPRESYLNIPAILTAAEITDAEAIHPGYGFLSENAKFAEIVEELGFTFIGPNSKHISLMGDKVAAKDFARKTNIPTIPGSKGALSSLAEATELANKIGYPIILKAASGGGGKGMKVAHSEGALRNAFSLAQSEATASFGDSRIYLEKYLQKPRHIEIQILADKHKKAIHLGERECSLQRNHQKMMEESPSFVISKKQRETLGNICAKACEKMGYSGAGTFEFLYENGEFFFIEMNTRLQVEHGVTELVTGIDIVTEQIKIAFGERLSYDQSDIKMRGYAVQCRITAENSENFRPSPGKITDHIPSLGPGVRVDTHLYPGYVVPSFYDPMISKLMVYGETRKQAMARLKRALKEYVIGGIDTTLPLHIRLAEQHEYENAEYSIHSLETFLTKGSFN